MAGNTDIENDFIKQEEISIIKGIVESMQDKFRIPIILYYTMEMSISEIALTLKIPAGTVKSRLFKARKFVEKGLVKINYEK